MEIYILPRLYPETLLSVHLPFLSSEVQIYSSCSSGSVDLDASWLRVCGPEGLSSHVASGLVS